MLPDHEIRMGLTLHTMFYLMGFVIAPPKMGLSPSEMRCWGCCPGEMDGWMCSADDEGWTLALVKGFFLH